MASCIVVSERSILLEFHLSTLGELSVLRGEGGGAEGEGVAADEDAVAREGAVEEAAARGALLGGEFGFAGAGIPVGDERAVG